MVYSIAGVAIAVLSAGALAALRRRAARTRSDSLDIAAAMGGLVFLASLLAAATPPFLAALDVIVSILPPVGWQRGAVLGALSGALVYLAIRVLLVDMLTSLLLWVTRRDNDDRQPLRIVVGNHLIHGVATASMFAAFVVLLGLNLFAWWPMLVVLLPIVGLPIYQGQIGPWIEYRKAREIRGDELSEARTWLREARRDGRIPRFRIRVRDTNLNNAMATAGMFGHLIVVGGGLLRNLEPHELKAVIAHEVAHVVNRDMAWLTLIGIAGSACLAAWIILVSGPLMNAGGARMAAGFGLLLVGAAVSLLPLQAILSPRLEYRADRVAATMMGDTRPLAQALARMAELTEMPMGQRTLTHPSYKARIEALARLQERLD